jgi:hypothetical protein
MPDYEVLETEPGECPTGACDNCRANGPRVAHPEPEIIGSYCLGCGRIFSEPVPPPHDPTFRVFV